MSKVLEDLNNIIIVMSFNHHSTVSDIFKLLQFQIKIISDFWYGGIVFGTQKVLVEI